jgi:hypothetical protein
MHLFDGQLHVTVTPAWADTRVNGRQAWQASSLMMGWHSLILYSCCRSQVVEKKKHSSPLFCTPTTTRLPVFAGMLVAFTGATSAKYLSQYLISFFDAIGREVPYLFFSFY